MQNIQQTFFFFLSRSKVAVSHSVIAVKGGSDGKAFMQKNLLVRH